MNPRFKVGDLVKRNEKTYKITAVGPRKRLPDEQPWYSLRGEEGEGFHIRRFMDAWDRDLEPA